MYKCDLCTPHVYITDPDRPVFSDQRRPPVGVHPGPAVGRQHQPQRHQVGDVQRRHLPDHQQQGGRQAMGGKEKQSHHELREAQQSHQVIEDLIEGSFIKMCYCR